MSRHLRVACFLRVLTILAAAWLVVVIDLRAAEPPRDSVAGRGQVRADDTVDIAAFAQVVTSDPKRMTGTAATRIQEFPAADIALETELRPAADGGYTLPGTADGPGCIGLRWNEMRFLRRLELHWGKEAPPVGAAQLQYWVGESPWQGEWKPLPGKFKQSPSVWSWQIADKDQPGGTVRVRWVFPASKEPVAVKRLSAYSRVAWKTADLRVELQNPPEGKSGRIEVYNGLFLDAANEEATAREWNFARPTTVKVRYSEPKPQKVDRTVLRFHLPEQTVCVAVEDVAAQGCVYVPSAGLFVMIDPPPATPAQYLQQIAGKKTVLEQVRQLPDQEFSKAMAIAHNPIQNNGPMLVGLACDNRKFVVEREGAIHFRSYDAPDTVVADASLYVHDMPGYQLTPRFGDGRGQVSRHLDGGWLPMPVATVVDGGVTYRQCTYVAPIDDRAPDGRPSWYRPRAVCMAEYTIENTSAADADASLQLSIVKPDQKSLAADDLQQDKSGWIAVGQQRLLARFDARRSAPLSLVRGGEGLVLKGKLAAGKSARLVVYLPAWPVKPADGVVFDDAASAAKTRRYWTDQLAGAMQIEIPDRMLSNVIRASQVHCLLAARNEEGGRRVAPWIAAVVYGPLESESQAVIRGMDLCGHADFARRGLDFFLKRYNDRGFLTTGYTLIGTGELLWTLGEHFARQDDREWVKEAAPTLARACKWIVAQRAKTKRLDIHGRRVPEYGLVPPGVTADWNRFAYRLFNDIQYCRGLETGAQVLARIGHPDAPALLADAKAYREDLQRACRWTQARTPVVPLANGAWAPNYPGLLDCFGNVEEFVPAEDGNRTWCYSVEVGMHQLAANRLVDPRCDEVTQIMDYMEDHQFLRSGWFDYPEEQNRKDVFNFGGFSKVQPYYCRAAEVYALRDDVKPFLRSYFNALSAMLNAENLSLWEHFHNTAAWNKTHETGWFLCQTATMFVLDRDDELWLAPMVTNRWLQNGMKIEVRNAPTRFGPVSYTISSSVAHGHIDAEIQPPTRGAPKRLVIRLRHPEGKPMKAVTVNGRPHQDFDPRKECVSIEPTPDRVTVRVEY